ncbi:hypothetical protein MOP88_03260 [Sphingomonas sp. WKB10]|nr:hypothetical protein [Sphingomonas sp. WKB10]
MPYDALAKVVVDHLLHLALDDVHFTSADKLGPILARLAEARAKVERLTAEQGNLIRVLRELPTSMGVISALQAIETDLQAAIADVRMLDAELAEARGTVPPDEHLRRVRTVSDSLATDAGARRMVRDALPSLIRKMVWDGSKITISGLQFF